MKKWLMSLMLVIWWIGATMGGLVAEEKPKQVIDGYGAYVFGTPTAKVDLRGFSGPILDTSLSDLWFYDKVIDFGVAGSSNNAIIQLGFWHDELHVVMIEFPDLITSYRNLDAIGSSLVKPLRKMVLDKYDKKLVKFDVFHYTYGKYASWSGLLTLTDQQGNNLSLMWDGYKLSISYWTADIYQKVNQAGEDKTKKSADAL